MKKQLFKCIVLFIMMLVLLISCNKQEMEITKDMSFDNNISEIENSITEGNYYVVIVDLLNVRIAPDLTSDILVRLNRGDVVFVEKFLDNEWAIIRYAGQSCYVKSKYIKPENQKDNINEDSMSDKEAQIEATTEEIKIDKHPELWAFDDPNTYTKIFYELFRFNHTKGLEDDRFRIDEAFRRKFQTSTVLLNTIPDRYEDEYPDVFEGDEQMCKQHLLYMSTTSEKKQLIRKFTVQFTLNDNRELSDIKILDSKVEYDGYQEMKDNYPKQLEDLKPYNTIFPILFCEYSISNDEAESVWNKNYNCYTDNFIKKYNNCNKCIMNREEYGNSEKYVYDAEINENNTDLSNKIIGLTLKYTTPKLDVKDKKRYSYRNIIIYFKVDDRNYLDNITKIEEVLEDGTVVELENNFGK